MARHSTSDFPVGGAVAVNLVLWSLATMVGLPVLIVLAAGISHHRRERLLATTGQRAVGYVVKSGSDHVDMSGNTYWVEVRYDCDGELVNARVTVSRRDWQQYQAGQRVGLTYVPSRPQFVDLDFLSGPSEQLPSSRCADGGVAGLRIADAPMLPFQVQRQHRRPRDAHRQPRPPT